MRQKIELRKGNQSKTFSEGYAEFINYCKIRNLREMTIKHYDNIVNYVIYKFLDKDSDIKDIN